MENRDNEKRKQSQTINTTMGDLILAISDAAEEETVREAELPRVTQYVLQELLKHRKN